MKGQYPTKQSLKTNTTVGEEQKEQEEKQSEAINCTANKTIWFVSKVKERLGQAQQ